MSRSCEFCGGAIYELARTRNHVWISCHRCQRGRREDIDATSLASAELGPPIPAKARFEESTLGQYVRAAAATALAFSVRLALKPLIGNASPFLLFTPAVMVAAWYGGVRPRDTGDGCWGGTR